MNRTDIPIGRENALTRAELARLWRCEEREARRVVACFRMNPDDDGYAILSSSNEPPGYWRSAEVFEIKAFISETESRASHTLAMLADARRFV